MILAFLLSCVAGERVAPTPKVAERVAPTPKAAERAVPTPKAGEPGALKPSFYTRLRIS